MIDPRKTVELHEVEEGYFRGITGDLASNNEELEAENHRLADAFDNLYFFAKQALSGIDFGNRRVLAFAPLVVLRQAIEQHRELAERLEEAPMNDGAIGGG